MHAYGRRLSTRTSTSAWALWWLFAKRDSGKINVDTEIAIHNAGYTPHASISLSLSVVCATVEVALVLESMSFLLSAKYLKPFVLLTFVEQVPHSGVIADHINSFFCTGQLGAQVPPLNLRAIMPRFGASLFRIV